MSETARLFLLFLEAMLADPRIDTATPREATLPPAQVECRLGVSDVGQRKSVVALASAGAPQTIDYVLEIETKGANRSTSRQRGTADLVPGKESALATAKFTVAPGEEFSGRVVINWNDGQRECLLP